MLDWRLLKDPEILLVFPQDLALGGIAVSWQGEQSGLRSGQYQRHFGLRLLLALGILGSNGGLGVVPCCADGGAVG